MENARLPSATLAEFYRFALLLTGHPDGAECVMAETLKAVERQLDDLRDEKHRQAWVATHIRQRCMENHAARNGGTSAPRLVREGGEGEPLLEIEAFILARRFSELPEPERSALGLFYIDLFTPEEMARQLKLSLEDLGALLDRGRILLRESLFTVDPVAAGPDDQEAEVNR